LVSNAEFRREENNNMSLKYMFQNFIDISIMKDTFINSLFTRCIPMDKIADLDITIPDNLVGAKVRELITDSGDWNWQLLEDCPPVYILQIILAIHSLDDANGEDARPWPERKFIV
jgi:hypothetical protein